MAEGLPMCCMSAACECGLATPMAPHSLMLATFTSPQGKPLLPPALVTTTQLPHTAANSCHDIRTTAQHEHGPGSHQ